MVLFKKNVDNSKTNEPHKFKLDVADKLNLKNPNKNVALVNLSIYYAWKNIKSEYNNYKFKISSLTLSETWFTSWFIYYWWYTGLVWIYHKKAWDINW